MSIFVGIMIALSDKDNKRHYFSQQVYKELTKK